MNFAVCPPAVTVVLPTHNRPDFLLQAISSLLKQTRRDWEAIIVDDASSPPAEVPDDPRIRMIRHESGKGGAACKNTGVEFARAPLVAFLDDDDLYAPTYLERALGVFDSNPQLDVVFMGVSWFGRAGAKGQKSYDAAMAGILSEAAGTEIEGGGISFGGKLLDALLKSVPMGFQRPVVRKSALARIGPYRPNCLLWDCDWAIGAALHARTAHIAEGLYMQRAEGQGYFSRGERRIEHMKSCIEIKERLLRDALQGHYPHHPLYKFQRAASRSWFDLAWHYYQQRQRRKSFSALCRSEFRQFSFDNLRLLARLLWPASTPVNRGLIARADL